MSIIIPNLVETMDEFIASHRRIQPQHTNRASELGHPCLRYLYYLRAKWEEMELPSVDLQYIFEEGSLHEQAILRRLSEAGCVITEQQRDFFWKEPNISGHIDGKIIVGSKTVPIEIKSMSPNIWERINSYEDLKNSKFPWVRKYPAQIQIYSLLDNSEHGILLLKNKVNGRCKQVNVELDYGYAESLVQKAETVNRAIEEKNIPSCMDYEEDTCGRCGFNHLCLPDIKRDELKLEFDLEFEALLDKRDSLKEAAKEYEKIDEEVKDKLKTKVFANIIVGDFLIESKTVKRAGFTVQPSEYKKFSFRRI